MKYFKYITNGLIIIAIAAFHTQFCLSSEGYGSQFLSFSPKFFFEICDGANEFPTNAHTRFDLHAAFWFFYFGMLLIPLGLLIHSIEREKKTLPLMFTVSYLLVVTMGSYMVPVSGMTFFMLPHAIFMVGQCLYKKRMTNTLKNNEL